MMPAAAEREVPVSLGLDFEIEERSAGRLTPADKAKIGSKAPDKSTGSRDDLFAWRAVVGSTHQRRTGLKLTTRSLSTVRDCLRTGVPFMGSADLLRMSLGMSFDGALDGDRVVGSFYTLPGISPGGGVASSDNFIRAVQAGILRRVEASIVGGEASCSVCGLDPFAWASGGRCEHIVGMKYSKDGKPSKSGQPMYILVDRCQINAVMASHDGPDGSMSVVEVMRLKTEDLAGRGRLAGRELAVTRAAAAGLLVGRPARGSGSRGNRLTGSRGSAVRVEERVLLPADLEPFETFGSWRADR